MARAKSGVRPQIVPALFWLALGLVTSACVSKPQFQCQSDASCIGSDGSHGTCEASGECTFKSELASQAGSSGDAGAGPSLAGSANAASGGKADPGSDDGSAGEAGASSDAGASCSDETARNCYSCKPQTSEQFLNACTSAPCVPFDDRARLTHLTPNGELPPLPPVTGQ